MQLASVAVRKKDKSNIAIYNNLFSRWLSPPSFLPRWQAGFRAFLLLQKAKGIGEPPHFYSVISASRVEDVPHGRILNCNCEMQYAVYINIYIIHIYLFVYLCF